MWPAQLFPPRRRRPFRSARRPAPGLRPRLEALEDRLTPSGVNVVPGDPKDWPMYNHDPAGTRYNSAETHLRPDNVGGLHVLWSDPTVGAVAGTPAVVNNVVYAADSEGWVYAVSAGGTELWRHHVSVTPSPILPFPAGLKVTTSLLVTNRTIVFGDLGGGVHGLDVNTGAELWSVRPDPHPGATIFGSATMVGNDVAIGISSIEELAAAITPGYVPTFRGSLVLLDPSDGHVIWQTYTISDADHTAGATGAAVWTTPAYDRGTNTIYFGTGNNYTDTVTGTSDALMAVDATDGHIKWVNQETKDDDWNFIYPFTDPDNPNNPPDFDFGDSPQVYRVDGRVVVGAGQKSGFYHVVDAATGAEINQFQAAPGGNLGGLFADSAVADGVAYANGSDWPNPFGHPFDPPLGGNLTAIKGDGSGQLWRAETPAPNVSGVAVANGVVYFQSRDGTLFALDAASGTTLAQVNVAIGAGTSPFYGQTSGPAVSRGQVYVGAGDILTSLFIPFLPAGPGAIIALGIDDGPGAAPANAATPGEHILPFQADATGSFTSSVSTDAGVLNTFVTNGIASPLGRYDSTGWDLINGGAIYGQETFTAANGDQFVKFFSGALQPDGTVLGTFTLGNGTGRFAGISGSGTFTVNLDPDGIDFSLTISGDILSPDNGKH
jgi:polyvinyl alcohol dehydrogenase (cytochrome)